MCNIALSEGSRKCSNNGTPASSPYLINNGHEATSSKSSAGFDGEIDLRPISYRLASELRSHQIKKILNKLAESHGDLARGDLDIP